METDQLNNNRTNNRYATHAPGHTLLSNCFIIVSSVCQSLNCCCKLLFCAFVYRKAVMAILTHENGKRALHFCHEISNLTPLRLLVNYLPGKYIS